MLVVFRSSQGGPREPQGPRRPRSPRSDGFTDCFIKTPEIFDFRSFLALEGCSKPKSKNGMQKRDLAPLCPTTTSPASQHSIAAAAD